MILNDLESSSGLIEIGHHVGAATSQASLMYQNFISKAVEIMYMKLVTSRIVVLRQFFSVSDTKI
jgi:hypothetical protein